MSHSVPVFDFLALNGFSICVVFILYTCDPFYSFIIIQAGLQSARFAGCSGKFEIGLGFSWDVVEVWLHQLVIGPAGRLTVYNRPELLRGFFVAHHNCK